MTRNAIGTVRISIQPIQLATVLLTVSIWGTLLWGMIVRSGGAAHISAGLLLIWLLISFPRSGPAERWLLTFASALSIATYFALAEPGQIILRSLDRAAIFFCFSVALNVLRDAASSSPALATSGKFLTQQPPARRYLSLTIGAHLLAIPLSVAAVNLLGAMIAQANRSGDDALRVVRERRMATALLRGHAAIVFWSPISVGAVMTLSIVGSLDWIDLAPAAMLLALAFMTIGWLLDAAAYAGQEPSPPNSGRGGALAALWPSLAISAAITAAVVAAGLVLPETGLDLFPATILVMPLVSLVWVAAQNSSRGLNGASSAAMSWGVQHLSRLSALKADAIILATAGYVSVLISALSAGGLTEAIASWRIPVSLELFVLPPLIVCASLLGINPLVSAVAFGSVLAPLPLPSRLALALAIQGGWVLALCVTPYSGSALMLARSIGRSAWTVTNWNWAYAALCFAVLSAVNAFLIFG